MVLIIDGTMIIECAHVKKNMPFMINRFKFDIVFDMNKCLK